MLLTPPPALWRFITEQWLQLSPALASHWWSALGKSTWSSAVALRTALHDFSALPFPAQAPSDVRTAIETALQPRALVQVLEDLVRQKLIMRREARVIEAAVLSHTDATGQWHHLKEKETV